MIKASDLKKNIDQKWLDDKWQQLERCTSGRKVFLAGRHIVNDATVRKFESELIQNGFRVGFSSNSHGVKTLVARW